MTSQDDQARAENMIGEMSSHVCRMGDNENCGKCVDLALHAFAAIRQVAQQAERERWRRILAIHWITAIECDHEARTDTVRCSCSVWTGTPRASVGAAVTQWIEHVQLLISGGGA